MLMQQTDLKSHKNKLFEETFIDTINIFTKTATTKLQLLWAHEIRVPLA